MAALTQEQIQQALQGTLRVIDAKGNVGVKTEKEIERSADFTPSNRVIPDPDSNEYTNDASRAEAAILTFGDMRVDETWTKQLYVKHIENTVLRPNTYQYPYWGIWAEHHDTFAWVELKADKNKQMGGSARSAFKHQYWGGELGTFKFLLQDEEFTFGSSHSWKAYEGWTSALNEALVGIRTSLGNFTTVVAGEGGISNQEITAGVDSYAKFDQSEIYENTSGISVNFSFKLPADPTLSNTAQEMCKKIEQLSRASVTGMHTFSPPAIWSVRIIPPTKGFSTPLVPKDDESAKATSQFNWGLRFCGMEDVSIGISNVWKNGAPSMITLDVKLKHLPAPYATNGWWTPDGGGNPVEGPPEGSS